MPTNGDDDLDLDIIDVLLALDTAADIAVLIQTESSITMADIALKTGYPIDIVRSAVTLLLRSRPQLIGRVGVWVVWLTPTARH